MKTKVISLITALALLCILCACGTETSTNKDEASDSRIDYSAFTGSYMDSVSGRATATVEENADMENVLITVMWAESASETYKWQMTATYEDGKLTYSDCAESVISYSDDGNSTTEEVYSAGTGYFEWDSDNSILNWTGAADENCKACAFEKMDEEETADTTADEDEVFLNFSDIMTAINAVQSGSSGSSTRAEEALNALITFVDTYSETSISSSYETLADKWFSLQEKDNANIRSEFKENLDVVTDMAELNGKGTDVAYLNVVNGIYDAIG